MQETDQSFDIAASSEGSQDLNGKDACTRSAPLISEPRLIPKLRIRGALVPMRREL